MAKQSSVNLDITNNADGFDISGGTTVRKLGITGGDVTIAGSGSAVVTFPTTSTTIAGLGITQSFSALQSFSAGISASGATFSGNISAPNIVTSVNGATGSVTTYAGTTGNIQFRYGSGVTANNYFGLTVGYLGQITDIFTLSGATNGNDLFGNQQAMGLEFERGVYGLGLDESGGVAITAKGIFNDGGYLYGANLHLATPTSDVGSSIIFHASGGDQFSVTPTYVYSGAQHVFNNGINSQQAGYTNNFAGPITGVTASFTGLLSASKGISAAGGVTLSGTLQGTTATFSGDIAVNGGDITTTSTTATLFNANATTLNILNTQSSGFTLNIGNETSFSGTKTINIAGNLSGGADSQITIGSANTSSKVFILGGITLGGVAGATVRVSSSSFDVSSPSTFSNTVAMTSTSSHTGLASFAGGLSASGGITLNGYLTGSTGFLFGPTSAFLQFIPSTSATNGGMWLKNGLFQIGGNVIGSGNGTVDFSPNNERFHIFGYSDFNNSYNYQAGRPALRINSAPTQSVPIFAAYKQTSDGQQLSGSFTTTNMVAGIDQNGALFSTAGISAAGGITFTNNVQANGYILTSNARSWFL